MCKYKQGFGKVQSVLFIIAGSHKVLCVKIGSISLKLRHENNPEHATVSGCKKIFIWCWSCVHLLSFHERPILSSLRCFHATVLPKSQIMRKKEKGVDVNKLKVFQITQHPLGFFIFLTTNPLILITVLCALPTDEETKAKTVPVWAFYSLPVDETSQAAGHSSDGWPSPGALVLRFPADIISGSIK